MTILHQNIQHADCHEPKGITIAGTSDAGKVITPSATVAGTSELRKLQVSELGTDYVVAGAWTPTFTFATPGDVTVVYTIQTGVYWRVGSLVVVEFDLAFTPTHTTAAGSATIGGLPFTVHAGTALPVGTVQQIIALTWPAGVTQIALQGNANATTMLIYGQGTTVAGVAFTITQFPTTVAQRVRGLLTYGV